MKIEVIYAIKYFGRILYTLKINNKYTFVYRGSGLNGGKVGRVLPFMFLKDNNNLFGPQPGYIYKEFYYSGVYLEHNKHPESFSTKIGQFLLELEKYLIKYEKENNIQEEDTNMLNIVKTAKRINKELKKFDNNLFDYKSDL